MHQKKYRKRNFSLLCLFLLILFSSCTNTTSTSQLSQKTTTAQAKATPDLCTEQPSIHTNSTIQVTVNTACVTGTSQYAPGLTQNDNSLLSTSSGGASDAVANVQALMQGTIKYENTHIMGWGAPDPWPDPTSPEPTDFSVLDARLQHTLSIGATPAISLDEAPWWMKGVRTGRQTTRVLTANDEWTTTAYESRILDNKMPEWLHLVQRIAERYMVAPYNVRYFQVWNELKGYYNPASNAYDFTTDPGQPNGPNAFNGYTYMYNQVYETLMKTAQSLHIPQQDIKVGGPYVFMTTFSTANQSNPSKITKAYGTLDQRPLDVIQYWLQHKEGAGFITIDGSNQNRDGKLLANPFTASEIFADVVKWIRSLDPSLYPGSQTLPVWLAEWFVSPGVNGTDEVYDNAVKSYAMAQFIQAGGSIALSWGGSGDQTSDEGYWTSTLYAGGGQPHPWYYTVKALGATFGPGKPLYQVNISQPESIGALATQQKILLINKTTESQTVSVNGETLTLTPHQVLITSYQTSQQK
jgi:hypothetical protein